MCIQTYNKLHATTYEGKVKMIRANPLISKEKNWYHPYVIDKGNNMRCIN